ncbi:unnamed protein product [Leptosia nina]|uniref:De-etiolated protein 1 n=1 Tax=Leptosia nina TaxID=320188 RepID=A0AAV1IY26_9NEOP
MNLPGATDSVYYEDIPSGHLNDDDFFCTEKIVPRKIKPQNIVIRLMNREIYGSRKPGSHFHVVREFYQNVFPNLTIVNVEKPPCFLRKFSPDGKHFIAFSADQTSLEIYEYRGAAAAGDLVAGYPSDLLNADADAHHRIRTHIFYRFFKPKFTVNVCQQRVIGRHERNAGQLPFIEQQLNRECSLFTEDGRYVIVGSAAHIPDDLRPHFYNIHSNNEAVTPTIRSALEDYSLHLVDLHHGKLCDTKHFRTDKIYLSHNQGIYLYKEVLAVLSVQHQTIHLFQIVEGMLIEIRKIGRFCYDDDPFIVSSVFAPLMNERPFHEGTINSLKHRLLVFLFKRAKSISDETKDPLELRKFYKYFDMFKSLRMWKMQLLDEDHLFIKYASEEVVTLRVAEPNSQSSFFVIYNISESKILEVYENTSEGLLQLFENYCDCFRNARLCADSQFTCSPSNNLFARLTQQRFKQTIVRAIYGGRTEATKRILAQLPISAQSYSGSPYLDLGLFSYDDKWVSVMERPKAYGEYPIRFYARDSGLLKFKIYAGVLGHLQIALPYTDIIGEGDVVSLVFPDGTVQFFFIPTQRRDRQYPYPFRPASNSPLPWSVRTEAWFIRKVSAPLNPSMMQESIPYGDPFLRSYYISKGDVDLQQNYYQKFHNDNVTSTTDIHYFYPNLRKSYLKQSAMVQVEVPPTLNSCSQTGRISKERCFALKGKPRVHFCGPSMIDTSSAMSIDDETQTRRRRRKNSKVRFKYPNKGRARDSCCCSEKDIKQTNEKVDKMVSTFTDQAVSCADSNSPLRKQDSADDSKTKVLKKSKSQMSCDSSCCDTCFYCVTDCSSDCCR